MVDEKKLKARERAKKHYRDNIEQKKLYAREYYFKNIEKAKERYKNKSDDIIERDRKRARDHYYKNRERVLRRAEIYRENNKDKISERGRAYAKKKPEKLRAIKSRRKKKVRLATPKWLTKEQLFEIESFYKKAIDLEKETGVPHQVDHIIPIQGKEVCGLHVPWNLQVLTQKENRKKSNKLLDNQQSNKVS